MFYSFTIRTAAHETLTASQAYADIGRVKRKAAAVAATLQSPCRVYIEHVFTYHLRGLPQEPQVTGRVTVQHYSLPGLYNRTPAVWAALSRFHDVLDVIDSQYDPEFWPPYKRVMRNAYDAARAAAFTLPTITEIVDMLHAIDDIKEEV